MKTFLDGSTLRLDRFETWSVSVAINWALKKSRLIPESISTVQHDILNVPYEVMES